MDEGLVCYVDKGLVCCVDKELVCHVDKGQVILKKFQNSATAAPLRSAALSETVNIFLWKMLTLFEISLTGNRRGFGLEPMLCDYNVDKRLVCCVDKELVCHVDKGQVILKKFQNSDSAAERSGAALSETVNIFLWKMLTLFEILLTGNRRVFGLELFDVLTKGGLF